MTDCASCRHQVRSAAGSGDPWVLPAQEISTWVPFSDMYSDQNPLGEEMVQEVKYGGWDHN